MKRESKEIIEDEESKLNEIIIELEKLKNKFIKLPWDIRLIKFLEYYITNKKQLIGKLNEFKLK